MEEFLEREAMTGHMRENVNGSVTFPPLNNRTKWDNSPLHEIQMLNEWFRTCTRIPAWKTDECMVGIPSRTGPAGPERLWQLSQEMRGRFYEDRRIKHVGKPVAFDAPPADRLDELLVDHHKLCVCMMKITKMPNHTIFSKNPAKTSVVQSIKRTSFSQYVPASLLSSPCIRSATLKTGELNSQ